MQQASKQYPLLDKIDFPSDLKKLKIEQLDELCSEIRDFLIEETCNNPGHLGSSLGAVEIAVALHYVYNAPYDKIVWDVGHQAYAHKILTGRKHVFHTNRRYGGISGFPKMSESIYDAFGVGHASTSISAALGMAMASKLKGETEKKIVAVIGDASLTGGLAFEGLNNAGHLKADMLVILNDNNMAIDPPVGALSEYLTKITASHTYNRLKTDVWNALSKLNKLGPMAQKTVQKIEGAIKTMIMHQSNFFESLGFRYFGIIDGHNIAHLVNILKDLREIPGPKLLHVVTVKGKGYKYAEENKIQFHSPGPFNRETGEIITTQEGRSPIKYQDVFGHTLLELAKINEKIIGVTPAMPTGCSMNIAMRELPQRCFDVGIAEEHAVTFSAGLATEGYIPYCNIYSSFMQRAYDQIIHDVAIQNLHVIFCLDRAGLVGEDGATHHGVFDIAYLRSVPNIIVAAPMNELELRNLMYTAQLRNFGPFAIRYPRGSGVLKEWRQPFEEIPIGKGQLVSDGDEIAILSIGHPGNFVQEALALLPQDLPRPAHYNMRFVKPLDEEILHHVFQRFRKIITVEDGVILGGFGSAVTEFMTLYSYKAQIVRLGVPDRFIEQGSLKELHHECGFDAEGIAQAILKLSTKKE
ncbi:MAG: 1-deoxy-D-xylulose-5-phosphate synthase [Bacteroidales bacterium]|nr:1-deoxy-D-xylulose-5-phosphate synthase [Bacteroidales bacterium]